MNPATFLQNLAELLAKSVLLLVPILILAVLLRRRSAALRHIVLLAAFVSLLLLPLGKLAAPHWRWSKPIVAAPQPVRALPAIKISAVTMPAGPSLAAVPAKYAWPEPARVLIGMWLVGVAMLLGFRAIGSWQIARLTRHRTTPTDARVSALAETVARELECTAHHEVRFSDATRVPCTWGLRRAVVLLPAEAAQWSEAHLLAALRHELAHVARRDYLTRWLSGFVCALYWPNPLVWLAARRLYALQEQACDDLVLQAGTPSADYATLLFETARACSGAPCGWRNAIAMARPSTLQNRVVAVVDETRDRRPAGRFAKLLGALGAAGVVGVSALAQVAQDAEVKITVTEASSLNARFPQPPQVEIAAQFIEAPKREFSAGQIVVSPEMLPGADLLGAPRVTTHSGQSATMQIGQDQVLPPGWEPRTQFIGLSLEVVPIVDGGKIQLQCTVERVAQSGKDPVTGQPIFNHRKMATTLTLASGGKMPLPPISSDQEGRQIYVLLEAKILPPSATKAESSAGPEAGASGTTIDPLLLEKPDALGRHPVPSGEPAELLRRSYLDIVGRPPTAEEMNSFIREYEATSANRHSAGRGETSESPKPGTTWADLAAQAARAAQRALEPPSGSRAEPAPESTALAKAKKIVLPKFELHDSTVAEAVEILRKLAIEADPEKQGVKVVVKPGSDDARITVSLTQIPLNEAFLYVASLANLELKAEPDALVMRPLADNKLTSKLTTETTTPSAAWNLPVEIKAAETHFEGNVAVASGGTQLKYGSTTISAESVRYNPDHHRAEFHGKVEIKTEDSTLQGENLSVELEPDGRVYLGNPVGKDAGPIPPAPGGK